MMEASLLSGLAIQTTRTALAHSMSYPLTLSFGIPHGLACGFTLPAVLEFNAQADDGRLAQLAKAMGFHSVLLLRDALQELLVETGTETLLKRYVSWIDDLARLAPQMLHRGRADNNLRPANLHDVRQILAAAGAALHLNPAPREVQNSEATELSLPGRSSAT